MQEKRQHSGAYNKRQMYLLRCWRVEDGRWRYAVEVVDGRSLPRRGFTNVADLLAFLDTILPHDADDE